MPPHLRNVARLVGLTGLTTAVAAEQVVSLFAPVPLPAAAAESSTSAAPPPEWVNIVPLAENTEGRLYARDGREFILDDPATFVAASNAAIAKCGPHPVDKNHEMQKWRGDGAALAWANEYELRPDGVYAKVKWLTAGAGLVTSEQYRYTSSNVRCEVTNVKRDEWGFIEDYDLRFKSLEGFTLTNVPALEVRAMFSQNKDNNDMDIKAMLALVGLPETASREEFATALRTRLASGSGDPPIDKFVPRSEHNTIKEGLADATAKLKLLGAEEVSLEELKKRVEAEALAEREGLLQQALSAGQILPANRDYYARTMLQAGGVEAFREFLKTAPKMGAAVKLAKPTLAETPTAASLTAEELDVAKNSNLTPEEFAKAKASRLARAANPTA